MGAVAGLLASCSNDDIRPDTPKDTYEQLTFSSDDEPSTRAVWNDEKGSGSLIFNWEADYYGPELVTLLTGEDSFIPNYPSENPSVDELNDIKYHSYMTISPKDDPHRADFTTLRYYNTEDKSATKTVFAVTPINDFNTFEADETSFKAKMEMTATFVQLFSQNPDFLRDYMMMYGQAKFENGSASIAFKHIPATFRFIITNKRPVEAKLETVSLTIDDATPVGSIYAEINGRYDTESLAVEFPDDSYYHNTITTMVNTTLQSQESYIAYALALPLPESESFEGKELKFVITTTEHDFLSFVLDTEQISNVNPNGEYNWVGGKSYTIRMSLDDVLTFEGISVSDWTDGGTIDGGVAEEVITE